MTLPQIIAQTLQLGLEAVTNTLSLLNEGCTIPFISRYRKERTGGLDEVQIAAISEHYERLKEIEKRKETDEVFKAFCKNHTRKQLCEFLTMEFGWDVDAHNLGVNIGRN